MMIVVHEMCSYELDYAEKNNGLSIHLTADKAGW